MARWIYVWKSSAESLSSLIRDKEALLDAANSIPSRLNERSVVWSEYGTYYAYSPYTGSFSNPQHEVYFQTRARIKFHFSPVLNEDSTAIPQNQLSMTLVVEATDPVAAGTHSSTDPVTFKFGDAQEIRTPLGSRIVFQSNSIDMTSPGRWFRKYSNAKGVVNFAMIMDPSNLGKVEFQVFAKDSKEPVEIIVLQLDGSISPPTVVATESVAASR